MNLLKHSRALFYLLMFILAGLSFTGCGSAVFKDSFDHNRIGDLPNPNPPGMPSGDLVWTTATSTSDGLSVQATPGSRGNKSLRFDDVDPTFVKTYVGFYSKEVERLNNQFYVAWSGRINLDERRSRLQVWVSTSHFQILCGLVFKEGSIYLRKSTGDEDDLERLGDYAEGQDHTVIVQVDASNRTYALSILQPGGNGNLSTNGTRPVLNPHLLDGIGRIALHGLYTNDPAGESQYFFHNVVITEKEPDMR